MKITTTKHSIIYYCLPVLMHAVEVTAPSRTSMNSLNDCIHKSKISGICSWQNFTEIQTIFNIYPVDMIISNWYAKFLDNLHSQPVFDNTMDIEYICMFAKYIGYMPEKIFLFSFFSFLYVSIVNSSACALSFSFLFICVLLRGFSGWGRAK